MLRLAEYHHDILAVLNQHGIQADIEPRGSGHLRFSWIAAGTRQSITAAKTPSDHRAAKNATARVRRLLREAGVLPPHAVLTSPGPRPPSVALEQRVEQLERDVALLLEQLTTPAPNIRPEPPKPCPHWPNCRCVTQGFVNDHERNDCGRAPNIQPVTVGGTDGQGEPYHGLVVYGGGSRLPPKPKPKGRLGRDSWLWKVLRYDVYLTLSQIVKASKRKTGGVGAQLTYWKRKGLVQHKPGVGWRKDPKVEQL